MGRAYVCYSNSFRNRDADLSQKRAVRVGFGYLLELGLSAQGSCLEPLLGVKSIRDEARTLVPHFWKEIVLSSLRSARAGWLWTGWYQHTRLSGWQLYLTRPSLIHWALVLSSKVKARRLMCWTMPEF